MSDSNYATYGELKQQRSPYSWLQPASTYAASLQQGWMSSSIEFV